MVTITNPELLNYYIPKLHYKSVHSCQGHFPLPPPAAMHQLLLEAFFQLQVINSINPTIIFAEDLSFPRDFIKTYPIGLTL